MAKKGRGPKGRNAVADAAPSRGCVPCLADIVPFRRNDYGAAALAALMAILVYLRTLPPTFTGEDSAEFITAAYTLGIAHPPGYPLFCMLGKLFTVIVPFHTIAWRVAFMSAFFGAATCFAVCLFIIRLTRNPLAGLAGALALAVSSEFWKWSVVVETYSLNAFLIVLAMLFLLAWYETRRPRPLYAFALAYGLGLCHHHTMYFMGSVFALFILSVDRRPWRRWRTYLLVTAIVILVWGCVHVYLPIRAFADPYSNWGNPRTLDSFWNHIMRKQYEHGFIKNARTMERFLGQMGVFGTHYARQFTPWLAALPLLGIYPLWKRNRYVIGLVVGTFIYIIVGLSIITNFSLDQESIWLNTKFWIPAYVMAAVLAGVAVAWLAALRPANINLKLAAIPMAAILFVLPLIAHYRDNDKSNYYFAYDNGMNILDTFEENAIYFPSSDHATYPLFYLQAIEGLRPDVGIVRKYGYPEKKYYRDMPPEVRTRQIKSQGDPDIEEWIIANSKRPAYFTHKYSMQSLPGARMVNAGLLYRVIGPGERSPDLDYWSAYTWHSLYLEDTRGDSGAENILSNYHFARGREFLGKGNREKGIEEMAAVAESAGKRTDIINNIGSAMREYGLGEKGKDYYRMALDIDPDFRPALRNLANVLRRTNDPAGAKEYLLRVIAIDRRRYGDNNPYVSLCINDLGGVQLDLGDFDGARQSFEWALSIDERKLGPEHLSVMRDLSNLAIALKALGDTDRAQKYGQRAVEILTRVAGKDHPFTQQAKRGRFITSGE